MSLPYSPVPIMSCIFEMRKYFFSEKDVMSGLKVGLLENNCIGKINCLTTYRLRTPQGVDNWIVNHIKRGVIHIQYIGMRVYDSLTEEFKTSLPSNQVGFSLRRWTVTLVCSARFNALALAQVHFFSMTVKLIVYEDLIL